MVQEVDCARIARPVAAGWARRGNRIKGQRGGDSLRKLNVATEAKKIRFVLRIFIQKYD
jgi:hypothetical protein